MFQGELKFDKRSFCFIVHAVFVFFSLILFFGRRRRPHTATPRVEKCRSAMIFNKRSLNFILVFSYKTFSCRLFPPLWLVPLKKHFIAHFLFLISYFYFSSFCCLRFCGTKCDSNRFVVFFFGETLKIIKCLPLLLLLLYPYSQTRCKNTQKRHRYDPLE